MATLEEDVNVKRGERFGRCGPASIHWSECVKWIQIKTLLNFTEVTHSRIPVPADCVYLWPGRLEQPGAVTRLNCTTRGMLICKIINTTYYYNLLLQNGGWFLSFTKTAQSRWMQISDFFGVGLPAIPFLSCLVNSSGSLLLLLVDPMLFYTSGSYNFPQINWLGTPAAPFTSSVSPLN